MGLHEEIEKVAYDIYEKSGRIGKDIENWLEAEKIVLARHAKKDIATVSRQAGQAASSATAVAQRVKEAAKEAASSIKSAARKGVGRAK